MRFYSLLLSLLHLSLVFCCYAAASSQTDNLGISLTDHSISSTPDDKGKRLLRIAASVSGDEEKTTLNSIEGEDRGILSSLRSKVVSAKEKVSMSMKLKRWAKNDESLDEVQKLLSMEGLSGTALTSHKNYKYLKQYLYNRQGEELKHMVFQDLSTFEVWKKLGLDTLSKNPTVILKDT
ncbi:RxLR effector protein, partial [Phytophthora megakarya]